MGADQRASRASDLDVSVLPPVHAAPPGLRRAGQIRRGSRAVTALLGAVVVLLLVAHLGGHQGRFDRSVGLELIPLLLAALGVLLAAAVALFQPERLQLRTLVLTSAAWSLSLLLALGAVWYVIDANDRLDSAIGNIVVDQAQADSFLAAHGLPPSADATGDAGGAPWRVPTGVLVQAIEFTNANDVQVTGYVWQRYAAAIPADVPRGFVLPEAVVETVQTAPAYSTTEADGSQLLGWRFHATLRQNFDYGRYPFDRQDVDLLLWSQDFGQRVVLVPDFGSYPNMAPRALPGVAEGFVHAGWDLEHSHFSYQPNADDTSFGFPITAEGSGFPELVFAVGLQRNFLEPFLDDILFALVVALLLFLVLCLTARDTDLKARFGISTFGVLGTSSGLLFSVILKDGQIRQAVSTGEIVYVEVLPFLLYAAILLVAANALLLDSPLRIPLVDFRNNLLPDLLYWPVLLGALLVITLVVFFVPW